MLRARRRLSFSIEAVERRLLMASVPVLNLNDSGPGSLRAAIAAASPGDIVDCTALHGTIAFASPIVIDKNLTIAGTSVGSVPADPLVLDGGDAAIRAFVVDRGVNFALSNLTVARFASTDFAGGGAIYAGDVTASTPDGFLALSHVALLDNRGVEHGGAVAVNAMTLLMAECTVSGNRVTNPAPGDTAAGGGVYLANGAFTAISSTFDHNVADAPANAMNPGGLAYGGGLCVWNSPLTVTATNCTFADNTASSETIGASIAEGGGAYFGQYISDLTLAHDTFSGNSADATIDAYARGGGLMIDYASPATVTNALLVGNLAANGPDAWFPDVANVAADHDLIGDGTGSGVTDGVNGNLVGTTLVPIDAKLRALADNGGHVLTMAPRPGSAAIAAGAMSSLTVDARNVTRSATTPTIGAFEAGSAAPTITSTPGTVAIVGQTYTYEIAAHDDDGDLLSFTYVTTDDSWNTLTDHGDGTATLTGIVPSYSLVAPFTLTVSDGLKTSDQTWSLQVSTAPTPPAVELASGTLSVRGSDGDDDIHVWTRLNGTQVRVWRDGLITNFDRSRISAIRVDGGAGADTILVDVDTLGASVYGGKGNDTITGGARDDTLGGGGGDDVIYGMAGRDVLRGHGGRDRLFGGAGDDRLYGGDGRDTLDGGAGFDRSWGEAGRDTFNAADGSVDRLDGGIDGLVDGDRVFGDANDLLTNVVAA